jgi:hypothetical protein
MELYNLKIGRSTEASRPDVWTLQAACGNAINQLKRGDFIKAAATFKVASEVVERIEQQLKAKEGK